MGARSVGRPFATRVLAWLVLASLTGGCALLQPPDSQLGTATTTYAGGRATLTIDGKAIVLDQVAPGPHLIEGLGPQVYWFNDAGWGVRLLGGGSGAGPDVLVPAMLQIDKVSTSYWSAGMNGNECRVTIDEADEHGLRGSATCTGLRWSDMLRQGIGGGYVEGQPAFDATVEFEATPKARGA